jgi:hypothetical protein
MTLKICHTIQKWKNSNAEYILKNNENIYIRDVRIVINAPIIRIPDVGRSEEMVIIDCGVFTFENGKDGKEYNCWNIGLERFQIIR